MRDIYTISTRLYNTTSRHRKEEATENAERGLSRVPVTKSGCSGDCCQAACLCVCVPDDRLCNVHTLCLQITLYLPTPWGALGPSFTKIFLRNIYIFQIQPIFSVPLVTIYRLEEEDIRKWVVRLIQWELRWGGCINSTQAAGRWRQGKIFCWVVSDGTGHYPDYFHYFIISFTAFRQFW